MARKRRPRLARNPARPAVAEPAPGIGHNNPPPDEALLVTRRQASALLNVSISTLLRMEALGLLRPIKLVPGKYGQTHYSKASVLARAETGAA